jgi:pimeloyl-ACP methyl ester carboxylesterase
MLLHGLMVDSEINWRARGTAALLAENFQVISLDMRGHGRSEKPRESKRYGVELVNDVIRLMDSLKINRAYVVGYSAGGEVVLKLMVTHPERVKSAAIGGTGWLRDSGPSYQAYMRVSERLSSLEPGDPIVSPSFGDGKYTAAEISTINENDPQAIAAFARSALELTISEDSLERNEVPALAIYGEIDAYRSDIELLVQRLANVTSIQIPDQDHDGTIGALEFRQNINSWLLNQETKQR